MTEYDDLEEWYSDMRDAFIDVAVIGAAAVACLVLLAVALY